MNGGGNHLTNVRIIETLGTLGPHFSLPAPSHLQGLWGEGLSPLFLGTRCSPVHSNIKTVLSL